MHIISFLYFHLRISPYLLTIELPYLCGCDYSDSLYRVVVVNCLTVGSILFPLTPSKVMHFSQGKNNYYEVFLPLFLFFSACSGCSFNILSCPCAVWKSFTHVISKCDI